MKNFRHPIKIIENTAISEVSPENWQEKFSLYAEIKALSDSRFESLENFSFGHVITEGLFLIKIRFMRGITTKMRIIFRERQFEIKRIINIEERERVLQMIVLEI
jgi:SPP1 family predicted phage head-tail adaptor